MGIYLLSSGTPAWEIWYGTPHFSGGMISLLILMWVWDQPSYVASSVSYISGSLQWWLFCSSVVFQCDCGRMWVLYLPTPQTWMKAPQKCASHHVVVVPSVFYLQAARDESLYCPHFHTSLGMVINQFFSYVLLTLSRSHPMPLSLLALSPQKVWGVTPASSFPSMGILSQFITSENVNN